jgi:hypothetical protein
LRCSAENPYLNQRAALQQRPRRYRVLDEQHAISVRAPGRTKRSRYQTPQIFEQQIDSFCVLQLDDTKPSETDQIGDSGTKGDYVLVAEREP